MNIRREQHESYDRQFLTIRQLVQKLDRRANGDLPRLLQRITIGPGAQRRQSDRLTIVADGKIIGAIGVSGSTVVPRYVFSEA